MTAVIAHYYLIVNSLSRQGDHLSLFGWGFWAIPETLPPGSHFQGKPRLSSSLSREPRPWTESVHKFPCHFPLSSLYSGMIDYSNERPLIPSLTHSSTEKFQWSQCALYILFLLILPRTIPGSPGLLHIIPENISGFWKLRERKKTIWWLRLDNLCTGRNPGSAVSELSCP